MSVTTPIAELLFGAEAGTPISADESTVKPWREARECLESAPKVWLTTVRPDGRPHVQPVLVVWVDEGPCFATRPVSRKAENIAANGRCVLSVASETFDLVVEGRPVRIHDEVGLGRVSDAMKAKYEWELTVRDGSAFEDGLPGSPEYGFYRVTPSRAFGYGPDGMTATRWRF